MSEEEIRKEVQKQADEVYEGLKKILDQMEISYRELEPNGEDDPEKALRVGIQGEDIPMDFICVVDSRYQQFKVYSPQPVRFKPEQIPEAAEVICQINNVIRFGSFNLDREDGSVTFYFSQLFYGSLISKELWGLMLKLSVDTVDEVNDKLLMFSKGMCDKEDILKKFGFGE